MSQDTIVILFHQYQLFYKFYPLSAGFLLLKFYIPVIVKLTQRYKENNMTFFNGFTKEESLETLIDDARMFFILDVIKGMSDEYHKNQNYGPYNYFQYHVMSVYKRTLDILYRNQLNLNIIENNNFFVTLVAALFHDVIEDTNADEKELRCALDCVEIHPTVVDQIILAVIALTKNEGENRLDNVKRIIASGSLPALIVKYADSSENLSNSCINRLNLAKQYKANLKLLKEQLVEFDIEVM